MFSTKLLIHGAKIVSVVQNPYLAFEPATLRQCQVPNGTVNTVLDILNPKS